ncbi:MAG: GNAT family N-acetyltransferase [Deltaproteobacteria bacterium]|nr:GNAT family N-acetyltransferase [Deltaproteobacteria bacterium]
MTAILGEASFPARRGSAILVLVVQLAIRQLAAVDRGAVVDVINTAARWYGEFLPAQDLHDPEMTVAEWDAEARRMTWYGGFLDGVLVGVMGLEYARDAALLRHAYILPDYQRHGIGLRLAEHLEDVARRERAARGLRRLVVGTYARDYKARGALENAGYRLSADSAAVLRDYYAIPEDRACASVTYEKPV